METEQTKDPFLTRITITQCRKVLKNENLTDEQILAIRDLLYLIGEIDYRCQRRKMNSKTIIVTLKQPNNNEKESNFIRPRKYRRAS